MINLRLLLIHGVVLSVVFSVFVVGSIVWKPRLWLQDFPADLQASIPPKTDEEKRLTRWFGAFLMIILFGGLGLAAAQYGRAYGFWGMFVHIYLVWQIVNLVDLVIIDWGGMHFVDPDNPPFPGTEGAKGYRDYRFHFIGFLKGSVMGVVLAALTSGVVWLLLPAG